MEPTVERREQPAPNKRTELMKTPQWSPPLNSGSSRRQPVCRLARNHAAMEPAGERREQGSTIVKYAESFIGLEWSPPVNGGSTLQHPENPPVPLLAAPVNGGSTYEQVRSLTGRKVPQWSPPVNGGSSIRVLPGDGAARVAAMEPAGERREQLAPVDLGHYDDLLPQWSPPVNGGSRPRVGVNRDTRNGPQWSPPVNGGSRVRSACMTASTIPGPQWSPPVNGGSRAHRFRAV